MKTYIYPSLCFIKKQHKLIVCLHLICFVFNKGNSQSFHTYHAQYQFENFQIQGGKNYSNYVDALHLDEEGFLWIGTFNGLFRYDGYLYKPYRANNQNPNSISGNHVTAIYPDRAKGFWVVSRPGGVLRSGGGVDYYNPQTDCFHSYLLDSAQVNAKINVVNDLLWSTDSSYLWLATLDGLVKLNPETRAQEVYRQDEKKFDEIYQLFRDQSGEFWLGTERGLFLFENQQFIRKSFPPIDACRINDFLLDKSGNLLIGTRCGLFRYNFQRDDFIEIEVAEAYHYKKGKAKVEIAEFYRKNITKLFLDNDRNVWVGCQAGIYLLQGEKVVDYSQKIIPKGDYVLSRVSDIFQDAMGVIWLGKRNGITKIYSLENKIQKYELRHPAYQKRAQKSNRRSFDIDGELRGINCQIKAFFYEEDFMWIGTSCGLYQFDRQRKVFYQDHALLDQLPELKTENITSLLIDRRGNYWIGANNRFTNLQSQTRHQLYYFNPNTGQSKTFSSPNELPKGAIKSICEDQKGNIWIACAWGLAIYDAEKEILQKVNKGEKGVLSNRIRVVFLDQQARLWIGTADNGVNVYDPKTNTTKAFQHKPADENSLNNNRINDIFQSQDGKIWIGTELGVNLIDADQLTISRVNIPSENANIRAILERSPNELWIASNSRLITYHTVTKEINTFSLEDGYYKDTFIPDISYKQGNTLYFGSIKTLYQIPKIASFRTEQHPPLVVTKLQIKEKILPRDQLRTLLQEDETLNLKANENYLNIDFATLDFADSEIKKYRYWLKGLDDGWTNISNRHNLNFINLQPGKYELHLQGSNIDGVFNPVPTILKFSIAPPIYWNRWSISFYVLLLVSLIYLFYRFQLNKKLAEEEAKQLRAINELKTNFYTNIAHEFRTPLTVIQGMTTQIEAIAYAKQKELIQRNSKNLLKLTNQLLDLSKLESGMIEVQYEQADVIAFLRYLKESFQILAQNKNIDFQLHSSLDRLVMDFDREKLQHVLSNLLSNAIKFTPEKGSVQLIVERVDFGEKEQLKIEVVDTGIGISKEALPHVFDRFYQAEKHKGSGVGLSLTQELVHLLNGTILIKSEQGKGTSAVIHLPITKLAPDKLKILPTNELMNPTILGKESPLILLVEDNEDVLHYLISCLNGKYRILTAMNGSQGLHLAQKEVPDLIISDVMMPIMDGYKLCNQLKNSTLTNHIPIVMLTAKADRKAKIEGLQKGADVYLTKPFDEEELMVRVEQLLAQQLRLQQYYSQNLQSENGHFFKSEHPFLQQIIDAVRECPSDDWYIENVAKLVNLSSSQVYRKVKALTGDSTTIFIRKIRLKVAYQLLKKEGESISEIAYQVGFKDPAAFSRYFSEIFGLSPSEFRKRKVE
ncbi:MAG: two-component regulator propeller domain-containing protein [Bacteroidota bacterium]